jgi:hypothetical protein
MAGTLLYKNHHTEPLLMSTVRQVKANLFQFLKQSCPRLKGLENCLKKKKKKESWAFTLVRWSRVAQTDCHIVTEQAGTHKALCSNLAKLDAVMYQIFGKVSLSLSLLRALSTLLQSWLSEWSLEVQNSLLSELSSDSLPCADSQMEVRKVCPLATLDCVAAH